MTLHVPVTALGARLEFPAAKPRPTRLRIWVMSDMRIDLEPYTLPAELPNFDVFVVAGNLSGSLETSLHWLSSALRGRQGTRPVVLVPGNTEFWDGIPRDRSLRNGRTLAADLGITLLSDETIRIVDAGGTGVHLIGSTFWTDWALHGRGRATLARGYARHSHRDCSRIRLARDIPHLPHDAAGSHARSRAYIEDVLASVKVAGEGFGLSPVALVPEVRSGDRAVVVTHHAPSRRSVSSAALPDVCDEWVSAAQASDAEGLMRSWGAPTVWIHGHVMDGVDYRVGRTRVVANPRGRTGTRTAFDPTLVVEV